MTRSMYRVECSACRKVVEATPPQRGYWLLIVSFWVFSLLFGIGAAIGSGWGFMLLLAWLLLAIATGTLAQHASSWTCSDCGARLPPPPRAAPVSPLAEPHG